MRTSYLIGTKFPDILATQDIHQDEEPTHCKLFQHNATAGKTECLSLIARKQTPLAAKHVSYSTYNFLNS